MMSVLMYEYFLPDSLYTLELGRELKKYCELSVFCRKDAGISGEGINWIPELYPGGKGRARLLISYGISLWKLALTIRKGHFDIIHIQSFKKDRFEIPLFCRMKKCTKKLVMTVHNVLPHELEEGSLKRYKKLYECCDELIVHNQASADELIQKLGVPERKITVIPHGIYQTYHPSEQYRAKSDTVHFLQFGFFRKYKGIDLLLEAIARIDPEKRKNYRFMITGKQFSKLDGTDYGEIVRKLQIEDCVTISTDRVPDDEIPHLMETADFLVFPYRNIYGSGALLMAYTFRKPVVASNLATFLEETEHGRTGFLFESQNPQALAEAIVEAAESDPGRIAACRSAIDELVREKYNWKKSAEKTAEVYRKSLREQSRS